MKLSRWLKTAVSVVALSIVGVTTVLLMPSHTVPISSAGVAERPPASSGDLDAPPRNRHNEPSASSASAGLPAGGAATKTSPPAARPTPICSKVIDIDLTTQQLTGSSCGETVLATPITSGRVGLRTPTGTFQVFLKEQNVYFYSPWPAGDPNYYPPMFIAYAMEFLDGGYFLHTDPDEPASAFGPTSEDGPYASHGCVHVPLAAMAYLYGWASDGTIVRLHY